MSEAARDLARLYRQPSLGDQDVARVLAILDEVGARVHLKTISTMRSIGSSRSAAHTVSKVPPPTYSITM